MMSLMSTYTAIWSQKSAKVSLNSSTEVGNRRPQSLVWMLFFRRTDCLVSMSSNAIMSGLWTTTDRQFLSSLVCVWTDKVTLNHHSLIYIMITDFATASRLDLELADTRGQIKYTRLKPQSPRRSLLVITQTKGLRTNTNRGKINNKHATLIWHDCRGVDNTQSLWYTDSRYHSVGRLSSFVDASRVYKKP